MTPQPTAKATTERGEAQRGAAHPPHAHPYIVVATAGHIDHGKSALVRALTGIDPDRLKEEKARGITIELGFAHASIGSTTVAFVDVPGHERFVKTMLAGVGGVDAVALIVAADESVMPQTREHFDICRLLQVPRGVVVLTKTDLIDPQTLEVVTLEVRELVAGTFLDGAPIVAVSAKTGAGLDALREVLVDLAGQPRVHGRGVPRLAVDRVFSMIGFGTVVTGTLQGGPIRLDDELTLLPSGRTARVRGLHMHGRSHGEIEAGHRAAVNLAGIEVSDIARGETLTKPGSLAVTRRVDAEMDVLPAAHVLRHGERVRFHTGTADAFGRLVLAEDERGVEPGARALLRVRLESPIAVTRGDRFILRSARQAMTVAGGRVLDPDPALRAPRSSAARTRLQALAASSDADLTALATMVVDRGARGMTVKELTSRGSVVPAQVEDVAARLCSGHAIARADDRLVGEAIVAGLTTSLLSLVTDYHRRDPLGEGVPREEARERVFLRADPAVFTLVLERLGGAGTLVARDRLSLAAHTAGLSAEERRAQEALDQAYGQAGLMPQDPSAVARAAGLEPKIVSQMAEIMIRQKRLIRTGGLIFHPDVLDRLKGEVRALKASAGASPTIDVGTFKQRYGVSRKFAIPLLEWLDRERVTRRVGEVRVLL